MKAIRTIIVGCLALMALPMQAQQASFHKQGIECLGIEQDGSQTVRVTGQGRNKTDAEEQAKKDAVYAVIFEGIRSGAGGCDMRPLINEVNARRKYEDYFDIFFMDKGEYSKYVSMEDSRCGSKIKAKNNYFKSYRLTVRVLRPELKARLMADNVIKKQ